MAQVALSPKYQLVIPKAIREQASLRAGQTLQIIVKHGAITLIPLQAIERLEGSLPDLNVHNIRDKKDRL